MGNRAVVVFTDENWNNPGPAVYLHWNGGPDSIYAFLSELDRRKARQGNDMAYQVARFIHVIGDYFDKDEAGSTSLGVMDAPKEISSEGLADLCDIGSDNGVYVVNRNNGKLIMRRFVYGGKMSKELSKKQVKEEYKKSQHDAIFQSLKVIRPKISN